MLDYKYFIFHAITFHRIGALKLKFALGKMFQSLVQQTPMVRKVVFLPKMRRACEIYMKTNI